MKQYYYKNKPFTSTWKVNKNNPNAPSSQSHHLVNKWLQFFNIY